MVLERDLFDFHEYADGIQADRRSPPMSAASGMPHLTREKVLHCSYHYWHPIYKSITPKARLIALSDSFIEYLRADGIVLPEDDIPTSDDYTWVVSEGYDEEEPGLPDPSFNWPEIHAQVKATIADLGGSVSPKLNWSAPRDATHMIPSNRLECKTANDIYLVLKSSRFIVNDLDRAFEGCLPDANGNSELGVTHDDQLVPYYLVLRKYVNVNPELEFRCFVRSRRLIGICQRTFRYQEWLLELKNKISSAIQTFFDKHLRDTFPDPDFVFDVYVPQDKVWLMDINTFSQRTDPLHFTWSQLLETALSDEGDGRTIPDSAIDMAHALRQRKSDNDNEEQRCYFPKDWPRFEPPAFALKPRFLLAPNIGPEALGSNVSSYSLINEDRVPQDVLNAAETPGGTAELLTNWRETLARRIKDDNEYESEDGNGSFS